MQNAEKSNVLKLVRFLSRRQRQQDITILVEVLWHMRLKMEEKLEMVCIGNI